MNIHTLHKGGSFHGRDLRFLENSRLFMHSLKPSLIKYFSTSALHQLTVQATLLQQLLMGALLQQSAPLKNKNSISCPDGAQSMGNNEAGPSLH
jgi:hypothetical protein